MSENYIKGDFRQLQRLSAQNQLLHQQLQDIRAKYTNLKKQQQIWQQINKHSMENKGEETKGKEQLSEVKQQFVSLLREKEQLQRVGVELREKVEDLKYRNQEMRQMSQKQERIHQKQIQFLTLQKSKQQTHQQSTSAPLSKLHCQIKQLQKKLNQSQSTISQLQDQLQQQKQATTKNLQKLQKCSQIAKEMQQYYNNQLQTKQHIIQQLQQQLSKTHQSNNYTHSQRIPMSPHIKLHSRTTINNEESTSSLKCSSVVSEYHNQVDAVNREELEDRYNRMVEEMRQAHAREIAKYQDKLRYLMLKVETLEAERVYLRNSTMQNDSSSLDIPLIQSYNYNNQIQHQQSLNLKLSKASVSDSLNNYTNKSQISHRQSQNLRQTLISKPKITAVKNPHKSIQKSSNAMMNSTRVSGTYQRMALTESNCGYL